MPVMNAIVSRPLFETQLNFTPTSIRTTGGWETIDALVIGKCAVNELKGKQPRKGFTVTHIASGLAGASFASFKVACRYTFQVQERFDIDYIVEHMLANDKSVEFTEIKTAFCLFMLHDCFLYASCYKEGLRKIAPQWIEAHPNNQIVGFKVSDYPNSDSQKAVR